MTTTMVTNTIVIITIITVTIITITITSTSTSTITTLTKLAHRGPSPRNMLRSKPSGFLSTSGCIGFFLVFSQTLNPKPIARIAHR